MQNIKVLPIDVANKIAAGEVAERPSSVVKELVENAIDAGAEKVSVEIKNGGIKYIRVTDDGCGIDSNQVETAFLRHATSKIDVIDDLYSIKTMGFRGEALASICAVAEVEVITKTAEEVEGSYLCVDYGISKPKEDIACNCGTTMIVKNLFSNVPARMKFLKKDSTESGYIADLMGRIALSKPNVAFDYICDDKEIFSTNGDGDIKNVVLNLYGMEHAKALIEVDYTEENVNVSGVIGKPELARGNRTRQTLFVNGRYVKNHVVAKVAEEAFRNMIMVGKFPLFILNIEIPPEFVDVNVHPAKTEIKFSNEKKVYDIVYHAVKNAIYNIKSTPDVSEKSEGFTTKALKPQPSPQMFTQESIAVSKPVQNFRDFQNFQDNEKKSTNTNSGFSFQKPQVNEAMVREFMQKTKPLSYVEPQSHTFREGHEDEKMLDDILGWNSDFVEQSPQNDKDFLNKDIIVGQVFDTYIIIQNGDSMFMIDQHAAHERFRFEKLKADYEKQAKLSQVLMTPIIANLGYS
ncbi:MAG: DNA mismatch repair endonuclease MutL, partial [Oscillospiraceae bacterium]